MIVIAVILTLAVCLLIDWLLQRRKSAAGEVTIEISRSSLSLTLEPPGHAGGFLLQEEMAYHPGHTWAFVEGPNRVRIGIDDFARRLLGRAESVDLPAPGDRLQQGQQAWSLQRDDRRAPMLAPLSGQVVEVNPRLLEDPDLVTRDPYREGWLMVVRPTALRANLNNLLSGRLVHRWFEDASARLRARLHGPMALSFPDGGTAVDDIGSLLSDDDWSAVVGEFLLTDL